MGPNAGTVSNPVRLRLRPAIFTPAALSAPQVSRDGEQPNRAATGGLLRRMDCQKAAKGLLGQVFGLLAAARQPVQPAIKPQACSRTNCSHVAVPRPHAAVRFGRLAGPTRCLLPRT